MPLIRALFATCLPQKHNTERDDYTKVDDLYPIKWQQQII
jgi:hypothetical protein